MQTSAQPSTTTPAATPVRPDERDAGDDQPGDRDEHDRGRGQRRVAGAGVRAPCRLERGVAGAQLLLLACGEQERVVDPRADARASRRASARAPGRSSSVEAQSRIAKPNPTPAKATSSALPRRPRAAEHDQQQDHRDHSPATSPIGKPPVAEPSKSSPAIRDLRARGSASPAASSRSAAAVPRSSTGRRTARPPRRCRPSGAVCVSTPATCGWRFDLAAPAARPAASPSSPVTTTVASRPPGRGSGTRAGPVPAGTRCPGR